MVDVNPHKNETKEKIEILKRGDLTNIVLLQ